MFFCSIAFNSRALLLIHLTYFTSGSIVICFKAVGVSYISVTANDHGISRETGTSLDPVCGRIGMNFNIIYEGCHAVLVSIVTLATQNSHLPA